MSSEKVSKETSPAAGAVVVTASDTTVYDPPGRALYVGTTGDVAVRMAGDQTVVTLVGVQGGTTLPICVDKVMSTNTTGSNIVLLR
jgi:hypothetical protein